MTADSFASENFNFTDLEARILAWATDRLDLRLGILAGSRARLPITVEPYPERSCPP